MSVSGGPCGFRTGVVKADNVNFSGDPGVQGGQVTADGQLLIGAAAFPNIRAATLTAGAGIGIVNGAGSITISSTEAGADFKLDQSVPQTVTLGATLPTFSQPDPDANAGINIGVSTWDNYQIYNGGGDSPNFRDLVIRNTTTGIDVMNLSRDGDLTIPGKLTVAGPIDPTYVDFEQIATPSNPSALHNKLYFKSDDNVYMLNSAGTETQVNGGSGSANTELSNLSTAGSPGFALEFTTASNQRVAYPTIGPLTDFTVAFWIRTTYTGSYQTYIGQMQNPSRPSWWVGFGPDSGGYIAFVVSLSGGDQMQFKADYTLIMDGDWHLIICTRDASEPNITAAKIYIDNVDVGFENNSFGDSSGTFDANYPLYNSYANDWGGSSYMTGSLDEMAIFGRIITAGERDTIWNGGAGILGDISLAPWNDSLIIGVHYDEGSGSSVADYSGNGYNGTADNAPDWVTGHVLTGGGSGVAINANLLPDTTAAYDFGSASLAFNNGYFDGTVTAAIVDTPRLSNLTTNGVVTTTAGDGTLVVATTYNNTVASGTQTAQTGAVTLCTATTPVAGSYELGGYINITSFLAGIISLEVDYNDDTGAARTLVVPVVSLAGAVGASAGAAGVFSAIVSGIRTDGSASVVVKITVGAFTGTFNAYGWVKRVV